MVGDYARLHAADPALMVVLGDHPPARFVAQDESDAVPVHVIGPPDLVEMLDGWGWSPGLIPAATAPVWPMEAFRDRFLAAYSSGGPREMEPDEAGAVKGMSKLDRSGIALI